MSDVRIRRIRPLVWLAGVPRWLRGRATFGLSTLLVVLTIIAIIFGVIGHRRERVRAAFRLVDSRFGYVRGQPPNVTVELEMSDLRGADVDLLRDLPDVKVLQLASAKLDRDGIRAIGRMRSVQELNLSFVRDLTDEDLDLLLGMRELRTLSIRNTGCTLAGLSKLNALANLRTLTIDGLVGDELVLDGFPQLEAIGSIAQGLKRVSITHMPQLRSLRLGGTKTHIDLDDLPMLGELHLGLSDVKDLHLTGAPSLRMVSISSAEPMNNDARHQLLASLASLPGLTSLDVIGLGLTDEDCRQLARASQLTHLRIIDETAQISKEGLRQVVTRDSLQRLDLRVPAIASDAFDQLSPLKFRKVELGPTALMQERRAELLQTGARIPMPDVFFVRPDDMRSFARP